MNGLYSNLCWNSKKIESIKTKRKKLLLKVIVFQYLHNCQTQNISQNKNYNAIIKTKYQKKKHKTRQKRSSQNQYFDFFIVLSCSDGFIALSFLTDSNLYTAQYIKAYETRMYQKHIKNITNNNKIRSMLLYRHRFIVFYSIPVACCILFSFLSCTRMKEILRYSEITTCSKKSSSFHIITRRNFEFETNRKTTKMIQIFCLIFTRPSCPNNSQHIWSSFMMELLLENRTWLKVK